MDKIQERFPKFENVENLLFLKNSNKMGITKTCTQLHPAPSTSTQSISDSNQLSATPSMLLEPKYRK